MIVSAVFHVYKSCFENGFQRVDGRLLDDMCISDMHVIIRKSDINCISKECNENGHLSIDKKFTKMIDVCSILSYGKMWELLNAGMSASVECRCDMEVSKDDIIYRVICED